MNQAHLHVALNHFPVVGAIIATAIMLFGLFKKNDKTKEIALWLFVAIAAIAIPVLFTGKNAAELVEHLPAVSEETIETHEQLATISFWMLIGTGLLAACSLYLIKIKKQHGILIILVALLAVVNSGLAGLTANAGGKIRHSEFENTVLPENIMEENQEIKEPEKEQTENNPEKRGPKRKRKGR